MRQSHFQDVVSRNGVQDSAVSATLHAGNFDGHWLSDTDVEVEATLSHDAFEMTVTAKNVGHQLLPMGIGWHPYFVLPGGDRAEVRLHIPSETRAIMNNYDDTFTTGQRMSVKGTPYDFSAPEGRPLGTQYLDDNYSEPAARGAGPDGFGDHRPGGEIWVAADNAFPEDQVHPGIRAADRRILLLLNRSSIYLILTTRTGEAPTPAWCCSSPDSRCSWRVHVRLELFTPKELR